MKKVERKVNDKELELIKSLTGTINSCKIEVADIEMKKYSVMSMLANAEIKFKELQSELTDKYGKISININDGSIKELKDDSNS